MRKAPPRVCSRALAPLLTALLLLGGCATPWPVPNTSCSTDSVLIDSHFEGGQLGVCSITEDGKFELALIPEDEPPINESTWYAFRVSGQPGDTVNIRMTAELAYARYWPKISRDGENWVPLDESIVRFGDENEWMDIEITLDQASLWIAGQELLTADYYNAWLDELDSHDEVTTRLLGQSVEGRPIILAETPDKPELILMMGRQHPPEVTGAIAMRAFIGSVLGDTELARQFRERFKLAIIPLMNPDGVAAGHWRHNVNGVDVNRDWGPFTQPESQSVINWLQEQEAGGRELKLMLDFHSTFEDLFYTQPITDNPPDFASRWLGASAARLPDFPFKHEAGPVTEQANAKNYFYSSRAIPAITYESGDETDREALKIAAAVFAEEMMREMLADQPGKYPDSQD
jgi:hypothetical protein